MPELHRKPLPGRYGTEIVYFCSGPIGGTNLIGGASPITANTTTKFYLPSPGRKCQFLSVSAVAVTAGSDPDGTMLATAAKYNAATDSEVTLSASIDLEALVTREVTRAGRSTSATDVQLQINEADSLLINVVNNSAAITTQPANLLFAVELALID